MIVRVEICFERCYWMKLVKGKNKCRVALIVINNENIKINKKKWWKMKGSIDVILKIMR
jgi:hypothetical protein